MVLNVPAHAQSSTFDVGGYMQNWITLNKHSQLLDESGQVTSVNTQDFRVRRARFNAKGSVGSIFSGATWVDVSGDQPALLDLYLKARVSSWLNLQAGQFVMPAQSYNTGRLYSSRLMLYERPSVTTGLAGAMGLNAFRDVGIMAYGEAGNVWYGFYLGSGKGRIGQFDGPLLEAGNGLAGARIDMKLSDRITLGGHLALNRQYSPDSHAIGSVDKLRRSGSIRLSFEDLAIKGLNLDAEYLHLNADDQVGSTREEWTLSGFYFEAGFELSESWILSARFDEKIDHPVQSENVVCDRYTFGLTRLVKLHGTEFARIHFDYSRSAASQAHLDESLFVMVVQLNF